MRSIAVNSKTLLFLKNILQPYLRFEDACGRYYQNSHTHKVCADFWQGTKNNFRHSFLGKVTAIGNNVGTSVLESSACARGIVDKYNFWKQKTQNCFSTSALKSTAKTLQGEFNAAPVKTGSIIIFTAILTNISFSVFLHKEITLLGWLLRVVLLGVSSGGLFCNADWEKIKKGSVVLRILNKKTI